MEKEKRLDLIQEKLLLLEAINQKWRLNSQNEPIIDHRLFEKNLLEIYEQLWHLKLKNETIQDEAINTKPLKTNQYKAEETIPKLREVEPENDIKTAPNIEPEPENKENNYNVVEKKIPVEKPKREIKLEESDFKDFELKKPQNKETTDNNSPLETPKFLAEKFQAKKLDSIKEGISILKSYEFQHNLFNKDRSAYSNAVNTLNDANDLDAALNLFEGYFHQYQWDKEDELVQEFKTLVYRRHI